MAWKNAQKLKKKKDVVATILGVITEAGMPETIKKNAGGTVSKLTVVLCDPTKDDLKIDLWAGDALLASGWQPGAVLMMDVYFKEYRGQVVAGRRTKGKVLLIRHVVAVHDFLQQEPAKKKLADDITFLFAWARKQQRHSWMYPNGGCDAGIGEHVVFQRGFELAETKLAHFKAKIRSSACMLQSAHAKSRNSSSSSSIAGVVELEDKPGQFFKLYLSGGNIQTYGGKLKQGTFWAFRNLVVTVTKEKTVVLSTIPVTTFALMSKDQDDDLQQIADRFSAIEQEACTVANIIASRTNRTVRASLRVHQVQIGAVKFVQDLSTLGKLIVTVGEDDGSNVGGGATHAMCAPHVSFVGCANCRARLEADAQGVPHVCSQPDCAEFLATSNEQNVVCTPPMVLTVSDGRFGGGAFREKGDVGGSCGSGEGDGAQAVHSLDLKLGNSSTQFIGSAPARDFLVLGLAHAREDGWDNMARHRLGAGPLAEAEAIFALCSQLLDHRNQHSVNAVVSCHVEKDSQDYQVGKSFSLQNILSFSSREV